MNLLTKVFSRLKHIMVWVLFFVPLLSRNVVLGSDLIAIDPERLQLIKDALSWMTFRRNGTLMTSQEVEDYFLDAVKQKYSKSKFYRTFVIAFQQGVLPRLTLKEGADCDPGYTFQYKDPINSSVTWFYQKRFTFESYRNRDDASIQFCDYREGLVCNAATKKCQCPEGTTMSPIEPGSYVKRCLLQKGEVCALMDMNNGRSQFLDFKLLLPKLMFNLEKPENCEIGTQCRFTNTKDGFSTAKCHDSNTDPSLWFPAPTGTALSRQVLPIGKECSIGLYSYAGGCDNPRGGSSDKNTVGNAPGYLCYNFGPPRSVGAASIIGVSNRTGFCAHDVGSYGITGQHRRSGTIRVLWKYNFVMGFVHRRSVPFDEIELKAYYKRYLDEVYEKLFADLYGVPHLERDVGKPCNVGKTKKLEVIWNYYKALEEDPLPGEDFVPTATKPELQAKLQELIDLVNELASDEKICKVYWSGYYRQDSEYEPYPYKLEPGLHCVTSSTPVGSNDGTCEDSKDNSTLEYAIKLEEYSKMLEKELSERKNEESLVDESILRDNPEPACTPKSGRRRREAHEHKETLEDGGCPQDFVCWEDLSESNVDYDHRCNVVNSPLINRCHDSRDGVKYDRCEGQQLDVLIDKEMDRMLEFSTLERGEGCKRDLEEYFRDWRENGPTSAKNKYKLLSTLEYERVNGQGLCDRTKLLECGESGVCECVQNTESRKADVELASFSVEEYQSDYCYLTSGACTQDPTTLMPFTMIEKLRVETHYGKPEGDCTSGNVCVYVDNKSKVCTIENTGKTGHDFEPIVVPPPPPQITSTPGTGDENEGGGPPGSGDAGGSRRFDPDSISMWILLAVLTEIVLCP